MKKLGFLAIVMAIMLASCKDTESYSDRLNVERNATNAYLKTQRVVNEVPADSVFEIGKDAPFYRIDPEGNVYMQVLNPGDRVGDRAKPSQTIYFRYTRFNLEEWYSTKVLGSSGGNENDTHLFPIQGLHTGLVGAMGLWHPAAAQLSGCRV